MIELPRELKRQHLLNHLGRQGTVFRFRCEDLNDPLLEYRYKFAAVVSLAVDGDEVLYSLTTSKIDPFAHLPWSAQVLRVPAGSYAFFPKETIIDLRSVKVARMERLLELPTPSEFEIVGELSTADRAAAVEIIRNSPTVERRFKKRCCT
jgi:hypothetical protein